MDLLKENPSISIRRITQQYNLKFNTNYSICFIRNYVKFFLGYRFAKKIKWSNRFLGTKKFLFQMVLLLKKLSKLIIDGFTIIYLDETGFRVRNDGRNIWIKEDTLPNYFQKKSAPILKKNLFMSCSTNGIEFYKLYNHNFNSKYFKIFLTEMVPILKSKYNNKFCLFLDNSKVHVSKYIKKYIEKENIKVLFNVKYYCQLNLIEYLFGNLKLSHYKQQYENE